MECTVRWGSKSLLAKPRSRQNLPNKKANFRVCVMTGISIRNTIYGTITRDKPRKSSAKESEWMSAAVRCLSLPGTLKLPYAVHSLRTHVWGAADVFYLGTVTWKSGAGCPVHSLRKWFKDRGWTEAGEWHWTHSSNLLDIHMLDPRFDISQSMRTLRDGWKFLGVGISF